jgi:hypothetical protein
MQGGSTTAYGGHQPTILGQQERYGSANSTARAGHHGGVFAITFVLHKGNSLKYAYKWQLQSNQFQRILGRLEALSK